MSASRTEQTLRRLRAVLDTVRLPLQLPGAADRQREARAMATQLDDYVLPRLERLDAPLLCVVGGSTGAGKSTLVNSLVGRRVTTPGVIRPTTKSPVLIHHPDDTGWFNDERILPQLVRATVSSDDQSSLQLVAESSLPKGLALLDAPDVDSVVVRNRELAAQLLQAADLWLFVTSAARYADAVPWEYLQQAAARDAAVAVVLDRVPPAAMTDVPAHLGRMMTERGLGESPLFAVPETEVDADGMLPDSAVSPIRAWLGDLAADSHRRQQVVLRTVQGAVAAMTTQLPQLATAADDQAAAIAQLRADAEASYAEGARLVSVQSADGTLLRGEVLARWHELVGTGEFMRAVESKLSWLRDRVWSAIAGKPPEVDNMKVAVESGLEALIRSEGDAAAERAEAAWRANPAGRAILSQLDGDLSRSSPSFPTKSATAIRQWQADVIELVSQKGMSKRSKARLLAFGVNGTAVALMVVVFAQTGGLTGAEVGIAGGASVIAQRLLEALMGDDVVRGLATDAKARLDERVQGLYAAELSRYEKVLDQINVSTSVGEELRQLAGELTRAGAEDRIALDAGTSPAIEAATPADPAIGQGAQRPALERGEQTQLIQLPEQPGVPVVDAELVEQEREQP